MGGGAVGGAGARGFLGGGRASRCALGGGGLFAAAERSAAVRRLAVLDAWRDRADLDAGLALSRLRARVVARARVADFAWPSCAASLSCLALRRVAAPAFLGEGRSTPARRAFDRPMAMACLVERTPCLPSRTWSISSRTNSPAWVDGDLPCFLSRAARCSVFRSGMTTSWLAFQKRDRDVGEAAPTELVTPLYAPRGILCVRMDCRS